MIVPTEFSTEVVNAGSDHAYSARGLRGGGGVLAVWSWAGENPTGPAFAVLGLSSFVYLLGSALSGLGWIWAPISVAVLLFGVVLSYLGIRPSLASTMWAGLAEVAVLIVIVVIDLVAGALLGPTEGALWLLTISGICIIAVPMVANTALGVSMWRAGRFRWLHGLAPSAATVLGGVVVFSSVSPCGPHRLGGAGGAGLAPGRPRRDLLVRPTPPRPAAAGAEPGLRPGPRPGPEDAHPHRPGSKGRVGRPTRSWPGRGATGQGGPGSSGSGQASGSTSPASRSRRSTTLGLTWNSVARRSTASVVTLAGTRARSASRPTSRQAAKALARRWWASGQGHSSSRSRWGRSP